MELFSEIYSCYYQVLRHLLCSQDTLTIQDIRRRICSEGFEESLLSIIPKLEDGTWNLFEKDGKLYRSRLSSSFITPVSDLEKSYLKALLSDPRIGLFLEQEQLEELDKMLTLVAPLWKQEQFYYFDRFADSDPYEDENYRNCFRTLLQAQKQKRYVDIDYTSPNGNRVHHHYIPARLEYSVKNDKFRILALKPSHSIFNSSSRHETQTDGRMKLEILNVSRIQSVKLMPKTLSSPVDLDAMIQCSYYKEPLKLRIVNKRNALERAMLHFANYEKNTTKIDENTYECLIYYNQNMETELLIEVMSFGPMLTVLENERFLNSLKARLQRQMSLVPPAGREA
ncbi:MAG: WYL domain-containing protein [Lachnospiraceae bacterium]|nr:WYL domain-containing protein [Lachnospiraceae bacterium]